jgi:alkanesulfonate monooxygenase SsuD/methylene tetrahydromethanopterin reductase-like flavin-dependent oxidoreductase (luciferase family)
VFTAQPSIGVARAFNADVKGRAEKAGRSRDNLKILPGCFVVVGDTVEEARAKRAKLDSLVHYANAIGTPSIALGHDASKFDPDGPLPDIPESNGSKQGEERMFASEQEARSWLLGEAQLRGFGSVEPEVARRIWMDCSEPQRRTLYPATPFKPHEWN